MPNEKFDLPSPSRQMIEIARQLRQSSTTAEQLMWQLLRGRRMSGVKFRRQHPIGTFVADFFCGELRCVIEIDGAVHLEKTQAERDGIRDRIMREHNLAVLRFSNNQVLNQTEEVLDAISALVSRKNSEANLPSPAKRIGRGAGGEG